MPDQDIRAEVAAAEAARSEAEQLRRVAEEARESRDERREAAEETRRERELVRETSETARIARHDERDAADSARRGSMESLQALADDLKTVLEKMTVVEEMRREQMRLTLRGRPGGTDSKGH
jgi:hypothetical protein